jgi:tetratricopeptide (TPR) repeat protein
MKTNYEKIKHQIKRYSFEKLKNNKLPLEYFEELYNTKPTMIQNAVKPELISAAVIYSYLRRNNLNGRDGITTKDLASYFGVGTQGITSKVFDVDCIINKTAIFPEDEEYEFIDIDRFEIHEIYYDFLEDPIADDYRKSEKILKNMIKQDPYFFDPYTVLHEYYLNENKVQKAFNLMSKGYKNAIELITKNGKFPDILRWGFIENRHIIRVIFNFATLLWQADKKEEALDILTKLLKSNPEDNIGARYSILAILEGFESQEHLEEEFDEGDGYLDWQKQEEWFAKNAKKYKIFDEY